MARRPSTRTDNPGSDLHEQRIQRDLDRFGVKLIKLVGVVRAALGLAILIAFCYWVIKELYGIWSSLQAASARCSIAASASALS